MAQQILPESPSGIYEILNTVTDKRYVGSAQNFLKRWREHLKGLKSGKHHSKHLQSSWDKHGPEAFVFQPILYCEPAELIAYEQLCIDEMNSAYNICRVAGSTKGRVHTLECRRKISAKALGRVWSEEARAKVSATLKGRKMPQDFCDNLKGNQHAKGLKHTDEWKAANSARMTGQKRPKDVEYRRKISEALKGRKLSEEHKAAVSAAMKGVKKGPYKPRTEEQKAATRAKILAGPPRKMTKREYSEEDRKSMSERAKLAKHTPEARAKRAEAMAAIWADPVKRAAMLQAREAKKTPERVAKTKAKKQAVVRSLESREKTAEANKAVWADPEKRAAMLQAREAKKTPESREARRQKASEGMKAAYEKKAKLAKDGADKL